MEDKNKNKPADPKQPQTPAEPVTPETENKDGQA